MSYDKHTWEYGNVITAEKMNEMENGIEVPNMIVYIDENDLHYYLQDEHGDSIRVRDVINNMTCFRGDTTYVTMYDGTKKLIQDVKQGDSLLGYNVNTKEVCETIVLRNIETGIDKYFDCYVFSDGTTLDIYGNDMLLARIEDENDEDADADGVILGCYRIRDLMKKHDSGDDARYVVKENGDGAFVVCKFKSRLKDYTPRFSLYTSNGTAFLNGLCMGKVPNTILELRQRRNMKFTPEINAFLDAIALEMAELDESLPNDHILDPSKIDDVKEYAKAIAEISVYKKKLDALDYYTNKHLEGEITDERWAEIHQTRDEYRAKVNEAEAAAIEYKANVMKNNPQIFGYAQGEAQKWKERQAILDAHLEDFREWATQIPLMHSMADV